MGDIQRRIGIDLDHIEEQAAKEGSDVLFGFKAFVMSQRKAEHNLFLLCHLEPDREKSEVIEDMKFHGIFKEMKQGGFGFCENDLVFIHSDEELVGKVKALKLTHLVDSKSSIFSAAGFPEDTQPLILGDGTDDFPGFTDWAALMNYFIWESGMGNVRLTQIETIKEEGENFIYKLHNTGANSLVLKHYNEVGGEDRNLIEVEVNHIKALREVGITNTPEPLWQEGAWSICNYVDGEAVTDPTDEDLEKMVDMLANIDDKRDALRAKGLGNASDARLSFIDYVNSVNQRWKAVDQACQRPDGPKDIMIFMMTDMEQMRQDNLNHLYLWCKRENWDREAAFPESNLIFSPGEFGLQNVLKTSKNEMMFFDFEHSGWDDSARVLADFFYNPEQNLPMAKKLQVLDAFVKRRSWDKDFMKRFWAVADLIAVEWIFRVLYVVVPEEQRRLQFTVPNLDIKQLIRDRFKLALKMHEEYKPMEHHCKHAQLLEENEEI